MAEPHPRAELDQPGRLGRRCRVRSDAQPLGCAQQQRDIADRLGGRGEQQLLRRSRKRLDAAQEALLDPTRQRRRVRQREAARQLRRRQPPGQLEQGERVAAGLGDDPVAYPLVQSPGDRGIEQRAGIAVSQARRPRAPAAPPAPSLPLESRTANTIATRSASRRRATNASVWAETRSSHWASSTRQTSGSFAATSESRLSTASPTRKRSGGLARTQAERRGQRIALRTGQAIEPVQHRRAQLVQPGEGELHLRLGAARPDDTTSRRASLQVVQQRRLADPRLAAQDQNLALTRPGIGQQTIQQIALAAATVQPRPRSRLDIATPRSA